MNLENIYDYNQIYNLAMISPITAEEKQKLIEIVEINDVANVLNEITKFSFYETSNQKFTTWLTDLNFNKHYHCYIY